MASIPTGWKTPGANPSGQKALAGASQPTPVPTPTLVPTYVPISGAPVAAALIPTLQPTPPRLGLPRLPDPLPTLQPPLRRQACLQLPPIRSVLIWAVISPRFSKWGWPAWSL